MEAFVILLIVAIVEMILARIVLFQREARRDALRARTRRVRATMLETRNIG